MTFSKRPNATSATPENGGLRQASFLLQGGTSNAFELWLRLVNELSQFGADRICETVKTQQQMMHCRNIREIAHLRAQWLQKAMDQYATESGRLAEIWREAVEKTVRIRAD